jgi:hypothetical protein
MVPLWCERPVTTELTNCAVRVRLAQFEGVRLGSDPAGAAFSSGGRTGADGELQPELQPLARCWSAGVETRDSNR